MRTAEDRKAAELAVAEAHLKFWQKEAQQNSAYQFRADQCRAAVETLKQAE